MPPGAGEVLTLIRSGRATTRGEILEHTGVSRMTVAQRVDALLASGLVREGTAEGHTGGRRPRRLHFNVDHSVVVAASVDTTHSRTALADLSGRVLARRDLDVAVVDGPERVLHAIADATRALLADAGVPDSRVGGMGICVPGPIDPLTRRPSQPPIMPGWDAYPVVEHLQDVLPVPVLVENDADAMALGEYVNSYAGCPALCFVKVSTGIGSGIIIDGQVYRGVDGGAGDIGHVRLARFPDTVCQCGAHGCLAAVASGRAVARALTEAGVGAHSGRDVRTLLRAGDVEATRRTQEAGRIIGEVMATVVCLLNPAVLLLGGDLASAPLISGVRETLYPLSLPRSTRHLDVRLAALGDDAGVIGMTRAVVEQVYSAQAVDLRLSG